MTRIFAAFIVLVGAAFVATWLADREGVVSLSWEGVQIETSLDVAVAGLAVLVVASALLYRFWRWLRRGPLYLSAARSRSQSRKGQLALTQGMVAVAAGDGVAALRYARQAETFLDDAPLTMLLSAQAAQINGDELAARRYFAAMLDRPEMEFLGLRGLLTQAQRAGSTESALNLARRAFVLKPKTPWLLTALFDLEAEAGNWVEAGRVIDHAVRQKAMTVEEANSRKAVTLFQQARMARGNGDGVAARRLALESLTLSPALVPAAAFAGDILLAQGKRRRAMHLIEQAWQIQPHPDLGQIYDRAIADETPERRLQRIERLAAFSADDRQSRISVARAAIAAKHFDEARKALEPLAADNPDAETCRLMADLEEKSKGPAFARTWLAHLEKAPSGPRWVCTVCHHVHAGWDAHCSDCRSFNSLRWRAVNGRDVLVPPPEMPEIPASDIAAAVDQSTPLPPDLARNIEPEDRDQTS
jgi:HemY protein